MQLKTINKFVLVELRSNYKEVSIVGV